MPSGGGVHSIVCGDNDVSVEMRTYPCADPGLELRLQPGTPTTQSCSCPSRAISTWKITENRTTNAASTTPNFSSVRVFSSELCRWSPTRFANAPKVRFMPAHPSSCDVLVEASFQRKIMPGAGGAGRGPRYTNARVGVQGTPPASVASYVLAWERERRTAEPAARRSPFLSLWQCHSCRYIRAISAVRPSTRHPRLLVSFHTDHPIKPVHVPA